MICFNCGKVIKEKSLFCEQCKKDGATLFGGSKELIEFIFSLIYSVVVLMLNCIGYIIGIICIIIFIWLIFKFFSWVWAISPILVIIILFLVLK